MEAHKPDPYGLSVPQILARTRARASRLVTAAGLRAPRWHRLYALLIQAVAVVK